MTPHDTHTQDQPDFSAFIEDLQRLWARHDTSGERWLPGVLWESVLSLYVIAQRLGERAVQLHHLLGQEDQWDMLDDTLREGWEELREALLELAQRQRSAAAWIAFIEEFDAKAVAWLTSPEQLERIQTITRALETRTDHLIGQGLDLVFSQATPSSPVMRLLEHRETIERWVMFVVERLIATYTNQKHGT